MSNFSEIKFFYNIYLLTRYRCISIVFFWYG